jgi:hypothetical protein
MTERWKGLLGVVFFAAALGAQTAGRLETPEVKVITVAGEGPQPADALNRVLIFRDKGRIGGDEVKAGDVAWRAAGHPYTAQGIGGAPFRIVEVELKYNARPAAPLSKLDAVTADPQHYKVVFENPQVRVLRVHYGAHEKGALHEHLLNRVVCYLNDQNGQKAGDVRMAGPATHTEENTSDVAVDRIAVELK